MTDKDIARVRAGLDAAIRADRLDGWISACVQSCKALDRIEEHLSLAATEIAVAQAAARALVAERDQAIKTRDLAQAEANRQLELRRAQEERWKKK